ncbi:hypothetical protein BH10ACT3_BH10ACT3_00460 [soil metagenome]
MKLYMDEYGHGPAVVWGHGVGQDSTIFHPMRRNLPPQTWTTITWDSPDHGFSRHEPGPLRHDDLADAVAAQLAERGYDRYVVGGLSQGGWVALHQAIRHPEHVAGLILMSCTASRHPEAAIDPVRAAAQQWARDGIDPGFARWSAELNLGPGHPETEAWIERWTAVDGNRYLPAYEAMLLRPSLLNQLEAIDVPVLVLRGEHDEWVPADEVDLMVELLPNAELVTIPGAWHTLPVSHPAEATAAVAGFLESLGRW